MGFSGGECGDWRGAGLVVVTRDGFSPCELVIGLVFVGFVEVEGRGLRVADPVAVTGAGILPFWKPFVEGEGPWSLLLVGLSRVESAAFEGVMDLFVSTDELAEPKRGGDLVALNPVVAWLLGLSPLAWL